MNLVFWRTVWRCRSTKGLITIATATNNLLTKFHSLAHCRMQRNWLPLQVLQKNTSLFFLTTFKNTWISLGLLHYYILLSNLLFWSIHWLDVSNQIHSWVMFADGFTTHHFLMLLINSSQFQDRQNKKQLLCKNQSRTANAFLKIITRFPDVLHLRKPCSFKLCFCSCWSWWWYLMIPRYNKSSILLFLFWF